MSKPTLSIVIVNWNSGNQLSDCIKSIRLAAHDNFLLLKVFIVDNSSIDESLVGIDALGVPISILRNSENQGFGFACNQGASFVTSEYLLFLNPDMILFKDSISLPISFMEAIENKDVGVVGIQLIDEHGKVAKSCARFPTLITFVYQIFGINRLHYFRHHNLHMADWAHDQIARVDHIIGAYYLIRHQLFKTLGGFDQQFFMYLEDLDLSLRLSKAGYHSVYYAGAQAFHAGGGTSRKIKATRIFYSLKSRLVYANKYFTRSQALLLLFLTLLIEPVTRVTFSFFRLSWGEIGFTVKAYYLLLVYFLKSSRDGIL